MAAGQNRPNGGVGTVGVELAPRHPGEVGIRPEPAQHILQPADAIEEGVRCGVVDAGSDEGDHGAHVVLDAAERAAGRCAHRTGTGGRGAGDVTRGARARCLAMTLASLNTEGYTATPARTASSTWNHRPRRSEPTIQAWGAAMNVAGMDDRCTMSQPRRESRFRGHDVNTTAARRYIASTP